MTQRKGGDPVLAMLGGFLLVLILVCLVPMLQVGISWLVSCLSHLTNR